MIVQTEDGGAVSRLVSADTFKTGTAVMQGMGHGVNIECIPFNKFTLMPEIFCHGKVGCI
jgi:hypothetical protein